MVNSINFPDMLAHNSIQIVKNGDATFQNLALLLNSEKGEFQFDPFFGIRLKKYMFEPNNFVLRGILADEIYEQIVYFIPQVVLNRRDVKLTSEGNKVYVTITCQNRLDYTTNTYNLVLFDNQE